MGICLSFLIFDGLGAEDAASRLGRAIDALGAWGRVECFGLEAAFGVPAGDFEKLAKQAHLPLIDGISKPELTLDDVRAAVASFPRPEWLVVVAACPIAWMYVQADPAVRSVPGFTAADAAAYRLRRGDVSLHVHKVGRRYFEDPLAHSVEAERIEGEIAAAREEGRAWKVSSLRADLRALAEGNRRERRDVVLSLFEAFATSFGAASVRSHLDHLDALAPQSSMVYYREAQALCDDLALIAHAAEHSRHATAAAVLGYLLRCDGRPFEEPETRQLLARLRCIDASEVRRVVASSPLAAPLADGFLLANAQVLPVGDTLVPFFKELVMGTSG